MKKLGHNFFILVCSLFVLNIAGCSMNPDMMLKEFNNGLFEDVGGGIYLNKDGASVNTRLIPRDVYPVKEHGTLKLVISQAYHDYTWSLKDNKTGQVYSIDDGFFVVYVGRPQIELLSDRKYTLTLFATNNNGVLFTDTATINVVK